MRSKFNSVKLRSEPAVNLPDGKPFFKPANVPLQKKPRTFFYNSVLNCNWDLLTFRFASVSIGATDAQQI